MSITVVYTLTFDEDKLDTIARGLYDADETVPGEPRPGRKLVEDWVEEAREYATCGEFGHIDTMPWEDAASLSIEVRP